jgi:hypothetical protein
MTDPNLLSIRAKNMADDIETWDEDHDTDVVAMLRDLAEAVDTLRIDLSMSKGKVYGLEAQVEALRDLLVGRR